MACLLGRDETEQSGLATPNDVRILEAYDKVIFPYKVGRDPESCLFFPHHHFFKHFIELSFLFAVL